MSSDGYSFGNIIKDVAGYDCTKVVRIVGIPNTNPAFINKIDENLWSNYWNDKSESLNIDYAHEQGIFCKNNSKLYWPDEEMKKVREDIISLTKAYYESAKKYNNTIAEPFIKERKGLMDKILE